jgi:hypothetical protein
MRLLFSLFALSLALSQSSLSMAGDIDWSKVDDARVMSAAGGRADTSQMRLYFR